MTRRPIAPSSASFADDANADGSSVIDDDDDDDDDACIGNPLSFAYDDDEDDDDDDDEDEDEDDDDTDTDGALPSTMRPVNQRRTSAYQHRKRSPRRQRRATAAKNTDDGTAHSGRPSLLA